MGLRRPKVGTPQTLAKKFWMAAQENLPAENDFGPKRQGGHIDPYVTIG